MQIGVFHHELRLRLPTPAVLKFRLEIGIEAELVVEKLLVAKQGHIRPNRFQKQGLTPTGVGTDQIRSEATGLELLSRAGTALSADDLGFRLHHQGMDSIGITTLKMILKIFDFLRNPTPTAKGVNTQGKQLMPPMLSEALNNVNILPGEILVDEENLHRLRDAAMIPLCPETHRAKVEGKRPYAT